MSEENPTVPAQEPPPSESPDGKTPDDSSGEKTFDEAYVKKLRSEAAANRVKANELQEQLEALTGQFEALEGKYKTQVESTFAELKATIEAEKKAREEAERHATRLQVATEKGLPPELADRLRGDTEEELKADADKLLGVVKNRGQGLTAATHPGARQAPPGAGSPPTLETTADEIYKIIKQGSASSAFE